MARTKSSPLSYWRNYFATAKEPNIFHIIDHAIKVAASDFPNDFSLQKDRIVAQFCSIQSLEHQEEESNVSDEADRFSTDEASQDVAGEVSRIKEILHKGETSEDLILESLARLERMKMTLEILEATSLGKVVSGFKRHKSEQIRDLARAVVNGWKAMVDEYFAKEQTKNEQVVPKKQEAVVVKPNEPSNKSETKMLLDEKLEASKRKLHESYQQLENTKRQRTVKVLDDLPKQEHKVGSNATKRPRKPHARISDRMIKLKK